jgi:hypothetical protein
MNLEHHQILIELLQLRQSNYDLFLDKLYDAITGEFKQIFLEEFIKDKDYREILDSMIHHFEIREEYEKCQKLMDFFIRRATGD